MNGTFVVGTDDDAVGLHEVFDRSALLQEFGVRHHAERHLDTALGQLSSDRGVHRTGSADWHGALVDDQLVVGHVPADAARSGEYMLHVGGTVFIGRRAHGDELDGAEAHAFLDVRREMQPLRLDVALNDFLQPGFENRNLAAQQQIDLALVKINAQHVITHFGKTCASDEPDVSGSHNGQFQGNSCDVW